MTIKVAAATTKPVRTSERHLEFPLGQNLWQVTWNKSLEAT